MPNPSTSLHGLVEAYLAGPKDPEAAGTQIVPVMIEIAQRLRGEELRLFATELAGNTLRLVTGLRCQHVNDIAVLVQLKNWLVDQRLTTKPPRAQAS